MARPSGPSRSTRCLPAQSFPRAVMRWSSSAASDAAGGRGLWPALLCSSLLRSPNLRPSGDDDDLIREERQPQARENGQDLLADAQDDLRREPADDEPDGNRRPSDRDDAQAGTLDFSPDRAE